MENQDYLSLFRQKVEREKALFELEKQKREQEKESIEQRKPAMFRKSFHKEIQKQEAESQLVRTQTAPISAQQAFEISKKIESLQALHVTKVKEIQKVLQEKQLRFLAFLTRSYSMLQFKAKKCEYHCYGDPARSMSQMETCLHYCQKGITQAYQYSEQQQIKLKEKLSKCERDAPENALKMEFQHGSKPHMKEVSEKKDPFHAWLKCYQNLLTDMDSLQDSLKNEFDNYD